MFHHVALSNDLFIPDIIIFPGIPTAGEDFTMICRLDGVVQRLVMGSVILAWTSPRGGVEGMQANDGAAFIRPLTFTPVTTSDANDYQCVATVNRTGFLGGGPRVRELLIQSKFMCGHF